MPHDISAALGEAARRLSVENDLDCILQSVVDAAAASLPGVDHAGITVAHADGRLETLAASGALVRQLDELQYRLGEGPCVYAIETESVVTVNHLRHDQRWPRFVPAAVDLGLRSQMGLQLKTDAHARAGLNLYSTQDDVIDPDVQHLAELFAAHAALALGYVRRDEELHSALATRKMIGQAIGIVMERYGVDQDQAFGYLRRVSSTTNIKLRDVAADLVERADHRADQRDQRADHRAGQRARS